jgi:putative membrane protein
MIAAAAIAGLAAGAASAQAAAAAPGLTKDETVFAILKPTGALDSVTVSDWLHSELPGATIRDRSDLSNIENVKGKEAPKRSGGELVWTLSGKDLYYRGDSTKPLPVAFRISYSLDGRAIEPQALVGKAGLVTVKVEAKNLASAVSAKDGRTIYAPMVVVVGLDLPAANFRDITVKGGSLISDGQNNIVAGILLPGLMQSVMPAGMKSGIDLSKLGIKELSLPESFEFTARTDSFKLGSIMMGASTDFPSIAGNGSSEELTAALTDIKKLGEASKQIATGSAALADGAAQLHGGIATATGSLKPLLAKKDDFAALGTFIGSDASVAAARDLLDAADKLKAAAPALKEAATPLLDAKNKALIAKTLDDAQGVDAKALLNSPLMSGLVSEENLKSMAEAMAASDSLYKGFDEANLQKAAAFASKSAPLLSAMDNFDRTASGYNPASGAAIADFAGRQAAYDVAASKMAAISSYDATASAGTLASLGAANRDYLAKTQALADEAATKALLAKLASGAALTAKESAGLAAILQAASQERAAIAASQSVCADTAAALPSLAEASSLALAARPAVAAAAELKAKVIPGLEQAQKDKAANAEALAAAKTTLDPKTVKAIESGMPRILAAKKAYEKNRLTFDLARTGLELMGKNGGFKAQLVKLSSLQQDLKDLRPMLDAGLALVDSGTVKDLLGADPTARLGQLSSELDQVSGLLPVARKALDPEAVKTERELVARLPELESGLAQLDEGSGMLADKLKELSAGTAQFDAQGIQKLVGLADSFGGFAKGFMDTKDELYDLSKSYRSFSGAPAGAQTKLKYVIKTNELH